MQLKFLSLSGQIAGSIIPFSMLNSLCVVEPPVVHAHFWWIKTFAYRIQFHVSPPKGKSCGSFHEFGLHRTDWGATWGCGM